MTRPCFGVSLSLIAVLLVAGPAGGYSIRSGLTEGCHEKITRAAFLVALPTFNPDVSIRLPNSDVWRKFAEGTIRLNRLEEQFPQLENDSFKLMLISIIVGVRSPDTEGHATSNLARLRQIHADPDPAGQYAHALRGAEDDGPMGDAVAVEGIRQAIIGLVLQAAESFRRPTNRQIITVPLYFDFYGLVDIEVWEPAYRVGRALHAMQDSFAHTIRSDDLTRIRHVLNYVDAIEGHLDEQRDGLPHSVFMDTCDGETLPIAMSAGIASGELVGAINLAVQTGDPEPIRKVLNSWVTHEPGCTFENDYCDSGWVGLARREQTGPYLEELVGCVTTNAQSQSPALPITLVALLGWALLIRRRRRQAERIGVRSGALVLLLAVSSMPSQAQTFVRTEGHVSMLSDAPDRSV